VYPPLPESFSDENVKKQIQYMIDIRVNPVEGFTKDYDYEKNEWKKKW